MLPGKGKPVVIYSSSSHSNNFYTQNHYVQNHFEYVMSMLFHCMDFKGVDKIITIVV